MTRRLPIATILAVAFGVSLLLASVKAERRVPLLSSFSSHEFTVYADVGRDRNADQRSIIMPEAFPPNSGNVITVTITSRIQQQDTLAGVPVAVVVECAVGMLLYGRDGGHPIPLPTSARDRIVDAVYAAHPEMAVVPRACFTSTTAPTFNSAHSSGVHRISLVQGRIAAALRITAWSLLALGLILGLLIPVNMFVRGWRTKANRCAACGYSLLGLTGRAACPECGKRLP